MTVKTALLQGAEILEKGGIPVARLTAEVLLCHGMRCDRAYLYAHSDDELSQIAWIHYGRYLNERLKGKPTQYITHRQEFYGRDFYVNSDVLIPRPETEHLVEAAIAFLQKRPNARVLDVGTGSGAIAVTVALESGASVMASDISLPALAVAERNRRTHNAEVDVFRGRSPRCRSAARVSICWYRIHPTSPARMQPICSARCAIGNRTLRFLPATAGLRFMGG